MKARSLIGLVLVIAIILGLAYTAAFGFVLTVPFTQNKYYFPGITDKQYGVKLGFDLVGGSVVSFEANAESPSDEDMQLVEAAVRRRLDNLGYFDAEVSRHEKTIKVEIPEISDPGEVVKKVGAESKLTFVDSENNVILEGKADVENAQAGYGPLSEKGEAVHYVQLFLTNEGQKKFSSATKDISEKEEGQNFVTIKLDDEDLSRVQVSQPIDSKTFVISGNFTESSAASLAEEIQSGQLPFSLISSELLAAGPSLGENALSKSLLAALISVVLVFVFLIILYRFLGFIASLSLLAYSSILALVLYGYFLPGSFRATISMPSIAAIIISFVMAVSGIIIVFDRIKNEFKTGKGIRSSIESGYRLALPTVLDVYIVFVIAGVMLWNYGLGPVKGFGITLFIGAVINIVTMLIYRILLGITMSMGISSPKFYGYIGRKQNV